MVEERLADLNMAALAKGHYSASPAAWEDQVLYFLMLDRFSDGREQGCRDNAGKIVTTGSTPPYQAGDQENAVQNDAQAAQWREAGGKFCGGTLKGVTSKVGYLQRMGVSAIWVSPIFRQLAWSDTYHGYGIQNFIDVDPRFGTREDLRELVKTAHQHGIYVILDIILNHSGDVYAYQAADPYWYGGSYPVQGFRDRKGQANLPFDQIDLKANPAAWPDGAIWPAEFQRAGTFTGKGYIKNWDFFPEFLEGDFLSLKDIHHGQGDIDSYQPSAALRNLCQVYKFWIAYADIDGYRVDTVKHMDPGATRLFTAVIKEFTQSLGKENFYLIGEITGGRTRAFNTLEQTGMDAALGVDEIPDKMEYLVKGYRNPSDYFDLFRNSLLVNKESHTWFRNKVVTMFNDHDQVSKGGNKARFCADPGADHLVFNALALNVTTLGIPCVYYGTEQAFDGQGDSDRYIREAMFGGEFGAFRSRGRHFFNEDQLVYQRLTQLLAIRRQKLALRRGRQYLRQISGDGVNFGLPSMIGGQIRGVVPWSRLFNDHEIVVAINTDPAQAQSAWVTIDNDLHQVGDSLHCIFSTDPAQNGAAASVEGRNGKAIRLSVPAAGTVIYE